MQISDRAISLIEVSGDEGESNSARLRKEGDETPGERPAVEAASLIIGLNVASADFDESSGFECPLRYVTVTLASQLTN